MLAKPKYKNIILNFKIKKKGFFLFFLKQYFYRTLNKFYLKKKKKH